MQLILIGLATTSKELEESLVLLIADFVLGPSPDGLDQVDCFSIDGDGEVDEVGILLHDLLDLRLLHEFTLRLFNVQHDLGSSGQAILFHLLDLVCAAAIRCPFMGNSACLPGGDFHEVTDDEGRVETHSKLSNDVLLGITATRLGLALQSLHELFGARAGYGA